MLPFLFYFSRPVPAPVNLNLTINGNEEIFQEIVIGGKRGYLRGLRSVHHVGDA